MYEPVELVMFNVFDYANAADWKAVKAAFYADNEDIKVGGLCSDRTLSLSPFPSRLPHSFDHQPPYLAIVVRMQPRISVSY
jgi:hypothetical protein